MSQITNYFAGIRNPIQVASRLLVEEIRGATPAGLVPPMYATVPQIIFVTYLGSLSLVQNSFSSPSTVWFRELETELMVCYDLRLIQC